ncbi:MAG: ArsR/SmtB family transcription factor [Bacillota bacterium]
MADEYMLTSPEQKQYTGNGSKSTKFDGVYWFMKRSRIDWCCTEIPRVRQGDLRLLPDQEAAHLAAVAKAFSDVIRVQMVRLLQQYPDLCTCEFEELLGLAQPNVSYHLKVLLEAGFVARKTYGTWSHYSLKKPGVLEPLKALAAE